LTMSSNSAPVSFCLGSEANFRLQSDAQATAI
jgi:hypothetical protein